MPTLNPEIDALENELLEKKRRLIELKRALPREKVENYTFDTPHGEVRLTDLFDGRDDLLIIHNMGEGCKHCMLWADGFNGVLNHLKNRTAVVMVNPDPVDQQQRFAQSRGWTFRIVRDVTGDFSKAMGFHGKDPGSFWPGATGFRKAPDGTIERVASAPFGEGDDFCPTWHLFDLLEEGWNGWEPRESYYR